MSGPSGEVVPRRERQVRRPYEKGSVGTPGKERGRCRDEFTVEESFRRGVRTDMVVDGVDEIDRQRVLKEKW